jgi:hypothetical protein
MGVKFMIWLRKFTVIKLINDFYIKYIIMLVWRVTIIIMYK